MGLNDTGNFTDKMALLFPRLSRYVVVACVFTVSVIGNSVVVAVLAYRKRRVTRMRFFILHLCIADLLVAFGSMLPNMIQFIKPLQVPDYACRIKYYVQLLVLYISTYVLLATTFDRYMAICNPLASWYLRRRPGHVLIACAWICSLLMAVPQLFIFKLGLVNGKLKCTDIFTNNFRGYQIYATCTAVTLFFGPLLVLAFCYCRIAYVVWKNLQRPRDQVRERNLKNSTSSASLSSISVQCTRSIRIHNRATAKTIKLTLVVILAYIVCWTPFFVAHLCWAYGGEINTAVLYGCLMLFGLNSCCNPLIFLAFSWNLVKQTVQHQLCFRRPAWFDKKSPRESPDAKKKRANLGPHFLKQESRV